MVEIISINTYLKELDNIPIIDVRSPAEYKQGHIPWAHNIALFSNEQRAEVGTVYKKKSKKAAIELGYTFVNPKLDYFIEAAKKVAPNGIVVVHCWRGGMRSQSFAEHLSNNGFKKVFLIESGYKTFRHAVIAFFEQDFKLHVVGGYTGSGKTDILIELAKQGEQVVDLEKLAHHKGSAFGGIGEAEQPSTEHFENKLFAEMRNLNLDKNILLEDESINIGKVLIPKPLFMQIRSQTVYFLDIPIKQRAIYLVGTYGLFEKEKLEESIVRITKRLGYDKAKRAIDALNNGNLADVAEISLKYYDKFYLKGLEMRDEKKVIKIELPVVDTKENALKLMSYFSLK